MHKLAVLCLVLLAQNIFASGCKQVAIDQAPRQGEQPEQSRAEQVVKALAAAYPRQIERVEFRNDDWALLLRDTWFYYADGRMLPDHLRTDAESYNRQAYYNYPKELPPWKEPSPEEAARFGNMLNNRSRNPMRRPSFFLDDLWRIHNRDESFQRVKTINFLGKNMMVHYLILEEVALVEERIMDAAKADPQVQAWVNNIDTLSAWNWRNIADTQNRSYHSYGLAIDILPKSLGGKETYWMWAMNKRPDWWNVSYSERFHPPDAVIEAFEFYGFIWGGKWAIYDTMHFEYRPEIYILSGLNVELRR